VCVVCVCVLCVLCVCVCVCVCVLCVCVVCVLCVCVVCVCCVCVCVCCVCVCVAAAAECLFEARAERLWRNIQNGGILLLEFTHSCLSKCDCTPRCRILLCLYVHCSLSFFFVKGKTDYDNSFIHVLWTLKRCTIGPVLAVVRLAFIIIIFAWMILFSYIFSLVGIVEILVILTILIIPIHYSLHL